MVQLTRTKDDKKNIQNSDTIRSIRNLRKNTIALCQNLCLDSDDFEPHGTIVMLYDYIIKWDRVFYSSISDYVFVLAEEVRGQMIANIERLYDYTFTNEYKEQISEFIKSEQALNALSQHENLELIYMIKEKLNANMQPKVKKKPEQKVHEVLCDHYAFKIKKLF